MNVQKQLNHWLKTPLNGYLGSCYGQNVKDLLQLSLSNHNADAFIAKIKADIPILASENINLYALNKGVDQQEIMLEIGQKVINLTSQNQS